MNKIIFIQVHETVHYRTAISCLARITQFSTSIIWTQNSCISQSSNPSPNQYWNRENCNPYLRVSSSFGLLGWGSTTSKWISTVSKTPNERLPSIFLMICCCSSINHSPPPPFSPFCFKYTGPSIPNLYASKRGRKSHSPTACKIIQTPNPRVLCLWWTYLGTNTITPLDLILTTLASVSVGLHGQKKFMSKTHNFGVEVERWQEW